MVPIHHNHMCLDLLADCNKSMVTIAIRLVAIAFLRQQAIKIKLVAAPCTALTFVAMSQWQHHIALVQVESFKNMTFLFASVSWCFMHNYSSFHCWTSPCYCQNNTEMVFFCCVALSPYKLSGHFQHHTQYTMILFDTK